jgi:streptogramin lyase
MCSFGKVVVLVLAMAVLGGLVIPVAQGGDMFAIYWAASGPGSVKRFNGTTGAFISDFVTAGSGGLSAPYDLDFGPDGNLYVSDYNTKSIKRYNGTTGEFIDTFITGIQYGVDGPNGVQWGPDGNIYTQAYSANYVRKYNGATGEDMGSFCSVGGSMRDFFWTPGGDMLVMSPSLNKVFRFAADGTALAEYAMDGNAGGARFTVCADAAGNMYVGAMNNNSIEKYDASGNFLGVLVTNGSGGLNQTSRVRIGEDGNLYASSYNAPTITAIKKYSIVDGSYLGDFATGFDSGAWGMRWQPNAVPEPSSVLPLAVGFLGLAGSIVRRKR